jgi:2-methylisocitrate lyase-like PEP mutase family enzyme
MSEQAEKARGFQALHNGDSPLLLANAWDSGSARLLASLGFEALATASSGFAARLGRLDGSVTRDEALAHCASIVAASELPGLGRPGERLRRGSRRPPGQSVHDSAAAPVPPLR